MLQRLARRCMDAAFRDDVDAEYIRLKDKVDLVHAPKLMPWGNRSVQFRDPEGTLVALFMPFTDPAKKRFASR
ncbi:hypothetical protein RHECIAT_CH0000332 [Rhizobium etli CIAT 652]|uniref:Glyoxalase/fosfomycin resistance/dioxygenase domain-containing protein n=2 Tax=Rhizobium TaxID=379 RepID=B3PYH5_RHIE6|nr:hypothetical protein RHECIAT_CH0000332 [Rhizobium etli CIAT 652]